MGRQKKKGGRPTKLDPKVSAIILEEVAAGVPQEAAARAAGIGTRTLYDWKAEGLRKPKGDFGAFRRALEQAKARAHARLAKAYYIQAMKNPSAAQFWFTRREPQSWAEPKQRIQLSGKKGEPVETFDVVAAGLYEKLKRMEAGGKEPEQ